MVSSWEAWRRGRDLIVSCNRGGSGVRVTRCCRDVAAEVTRLRVAAIERQERAHERGGSNLWDLRVDLDPSIQLDGPMVPK